MITNIREVMDGNNFADDSSVVNEKVRKINDRIRTKNKRTDRLLLRI